MNSQHPIKKKQDPVPHDPRNEPIPEPKKDKERRSVEEAERKARKEEGLDMKKPKDDLPTGAIGKGSKDDKIVTEDEYGMPTGIQVGQITRGSSSTDLAPDSAQLEDTRSGVDGTDVRAKSRYDLTLETDRVDLQL